MSINCACLKNNGQGSSSDIPWGWRKKKKPQQKPDIILPVWRISLVCSHVSGWYKLRRVGGRVGTGEMFGSHTRMEGWRTRQSVWYMMYGSRTEMCGERAHICRSPLRKLEVFCSMLLMGAWGSCGDQMSALLSGYTHTIWGFAGFPHQRKKKLSNIHMDKPYFMAKINICPHSSLCHLIGLLYSQRVVFVFLRLKYDY